MEHEQQPGLWHQFYPPDPHQQPQDGTQLYQSQPQDTAHYQTPQAPTSYSYLVPHTPVPSACSLTAHVMWQRAHRA